MKAVYQNVFSEQRQEVDKKINTYFEDIIDANANPISHDISHDIEKAP